MSKKLVDFKLDELLQDHEDRLSSVEKTTGSPIDESRITKLENQVELLTQLLRPASTSSQA